MANEEQLRILKEEGVGAWNEWRKENSEIEPDLSGVQLPWQDLRQADFRGADLSKTNLRLADLTGADLSRIKLIKANLIKSNLTRNDIMRGDSSRASLIEADLTGANLTGAKLNDAVLIQTQALGTNFESAILTGACIENWNINSETNLNNVICNYLFLKANSKDRFPMDRDFVPGEFTKLFSKASSIIELIFNQGVDWVSFAYSFKKLSIENEDSELIIQSIENRQGITVIKVKLASNTDKSKIYSDFWQEYKFAQKTLKEQYELRLLDQDKTINRQDQYINQLFYSLNQAHERLGEVPRLMAENPRKVSKFEIHNSPISGLVDANQVEANQIGGNITYTPEQKQTIAEAAAEIQQLLEQLSKTYPTSTNKEKMTVVAEVVDQIENNPTLKTRVINSLRAGGVEAFKEAIDHPLVNILMATIEGWREVETE